MVYRKLINRDLSLPLFFCPKCGADRPYQVKQISLQTAFYHIPLFESDNLEHVVECQFCKKGFDTKVLGRKNQILLKLAVVARFEISRGLSPEELKAKLISEGLRERFVDTLLVLAQS